MIFARVDFRGMMVGGVVRLVTGTVADCILPWSAKQLATLPNQIETR